jgi:hypothetical protein
VLLIRERRINITLDVDPARTSRAHGDALLVVSHPADDLMPQLPRPLGKASENLAALERGGDLGKLAILGNVPPARCDRPITATDRDPPKPGFSCSGVTLSLGHHPTPNRSPTPPAR